MTLENPLHKYASYNYRWKFGLIGPENLSQPEVYRTNGPDLTIIQSGGFPDKGIKTFAEESLGVNVEFYIDDFTGDYLVVPNPGSSNSNAIQVQFKVYEPLSVGLFFQTLRLACDDLYQGNRGYLDVPFCLQLDFVGYDDNGNTHIEPPHTLALKLVNVVFNVDQSGSVYTVDAIPWNHQAFMDSIQRVRTDVTISAETVYNMLGGDVDTSLVQTLDKMEIAAELENNVIAGNRYRIEFPTDPSLGGVAGSPPNLRTNIVLDPRGEDRTTATTDDLQAQRNRERNTLVTVDTPAGPQQVDPFVQVKTEQASLAANSDVNYIGQSAIVTDFNQYGNNPFGVEQFVFDEGNEQQSGDEVFTRGTLSIDANTREFTFKQGTKIERIISQVILSSEWGLNLINQQPDADGNVTWFKIHCETRILNTDEIANSGTPAYEFVYRVTPFLIDASIIAPSWQDQDYSPKISKALKTYYYTYTGLNMDIINFEFNIDNAFYKELSRRSSQSRQDNMQGGASGQAVASEPVPEAVPTRGPDDGNRGSSQSGLMSKSQIVGTSNESPANGASVAARDVANTFQTAILNSDVDNVVLDLKIWGDPYYFMDSDVGNFISPSGGNPNVTYDNKIDPSRNEVYVLIHFRTGVDYNGNLIQIDPTNAFSGIYRVLTFTNNFSNGMFTQNLSLARMPNQTIESVESSNSVVEANRSGNLPLVIGNLQQEAANRTREFALMLKQAEELERVSTAFRQAGITEIEDLLSGTQIADFAQDLFGAFNQIGQIQSTLQNTLGALQGGLPNLANTVARNAINNAIAGTPIGGVVQNVTRIKSDIQDIRSNLGRFGR